MDFNGTTVYATKDKAIHGLISDLFARKTGARDDAVYTSQSKTHYDWLVICGGSIGHNLGQYDNKEITLMELYNLPDYIEPPKTKEMTLPEIIKELGYEVKIVK